MENLEVKFAELIKENNEALKAKMAALEAAQENGLKSEDLETLKAEIAAHNEKAEDYTKKQQEQLDDLATKFKKAQSDISQAEYKKDALKATIKENFDSIKNVRKGVTFNTKAVGDMTLINNLTGDQPRDYNFDTVMVPTPLVNVQDLVGTVTIDGGTYTFPRETGSEGAFTTPTEGQAKGQIDYDLAMIDVNTDYIAGYARYSKKMRNNLPFLESFIPRALRRDYLKAENANFQAVLAAAATASTVITGNYIERLISNIAALEGADYMVNGIVINPADYWTIMVTEKSTGAGYGLPGVVTMEGGNLRINGIPIYKATWVPANKYYVGDWSRVNRIVTEGFSLDFSEEDGNNFVNNLITARAECQCALAVEQPAALIYGDFTALT